MNENGDTESDNPAATPNTNSRRNSGTNSAAGSAQNPDGQETGARPWMDVEPGRLVGKGHGPGDILEAWKWTLLEQSRGLVVVEAHLPEALKNPQGQLFGGFTTTYVDFVSLHTVHSVDGVEADDIDQDPTTRRNWLTTINMRCDYFEPIFGPTFTIRGEIVNQRGLTSLVSTKFFQGETMLAHGLTTLRTIPSKD